MNNIRTAQAIASRFAAGGTDFGRVYLRRDGDYGLLNYTPEAMYGGDMTNVEKACRGLVIRDDGKIMALPMPKFFNLGEPQCPPLPNEPYQVWEKIDGSLGIFWHDEQRWRCNTRGSFDNEYVAFALDYWNQRIGDWGIPNHWTIMVEICIDNDVNPRAAHYTEGLWLIAARDNYSGKDIDILTLPVRDRMFLWPEQTTNAALRDLIQLQQNVEGREGWVVRYDSGLRIKIKTAWYLRMFRAVMYLSPKHIRELMLDAGQDWIDEFPDDLRPEAVSIQAEIESKFQGVLADIYSAYSKVAGIEPRKDFALKVKADYPEIASWLFALRDDKFDKMDVLKRLELLDTPC